MPYKNQTIKTLLLFFISSCCTIAIAQSGLEEIRDNTYGVDGIVDLYAMGFEDCDLIETDELHNQYVIEHRDHAIEIIKLQENGDQIMNYGVNGKVTIDSVTVTRFMLSKTYEQKLYLMAEDQDTMFLYAFTADGQIEEEFGQGERIVATNIEANYNYFWMDIIDDVILVASFDGALSSGTYTVIIDRFSLEGVNLATDTIPFIDNPQVAVSKVLFRPSDEIYIVYADMPNLDSTNINIRRFKNVTTLDSSFAVDGTYTIPDEIFNNFNLIVQEDQLTISYLVDEHYIKHERLNSFGEVLYENLSLKIDLDNQSFEFMIRSDISLSNDGYFVLEKIFNSNSNITRYFTKYNNELELDSTFGQDGSYLMSGISDWRTVDDLERIYIITRTVNYLTLIRTGANVISAIDKIEEKYNKIKIYPNPTNSTVRIYSEDKFQGDVLCKIYDYKGTPLRTEHFGSLDFQLDLSDYKKGLYIIRLVSSTMSHAQVILKN